MPDASTLITKFRNAVDDSLDSDYELELLNDAKNEIEDMAEWEILKKETSFSVSSGYSYTSVATALPTRFALPVAMYEDTGNIPYNKIDFEDRASKRNNSLGYFIDLNAGNIHLTGENHSAKTMYFYYTEYSADLTTADTWQFPARFHNALVYKMAEIYYASDAGEKGRSWDDRWSIQFERILRRMEAWNDRLKTKGRRPRSLSYVSPKAI